MIPEASAGEGTGPGPSSGATILVAEDDAPFRFILVEAFRDEGFEVVSAANGAEALDIYRRNAEKIDVVVADIIMPGMDGLTAAVEMRKIDDNVIFLFMSGYGPEHIKKIGVDMDDIPNSAFFLKPFAFRDMVRMIRSRKLPNQT